MALSYIKVFLDYLEAIAPLDDAERGRLFTGLLVYGKTGKDPNLQGNERFLFPMMRLQMDRDAASYESSVEAGREFGHLGGRPKKTPGVFSKPPKTQDKDKEEEKDKDKEKDSSSGGACGPAQRKNTVKRRTASKTDSPEAIRADMDRMERYLLQLREEVAGGSDA